MPGGAIRAAFVFLRMDPALAAMPAEDLALAQAAGVILLWSDRAFEGAGPLARGRRAGDPAARYFGSDPCRL